MANTAWEVLPVMTPKTLITGEQSGWFATLALRRVNGQWQYRKPTKDELVQWDTDRQY
jgi:hypothetical protein